MNSFKISFFRFQLIAWGVVYMLILLFNFQRESFTESFIYAFLTIAFYSIILYGNANWLIPGYYYKKKYFSYFLLAILLLLIITYVRAYAGVFIFNYFFAGKYSPLTFKTFLFHGLAGIFVFIFSILYRISIDYFNLKRQKENIDLQRVQAELISLRQQVQPHFLFNTLNNIYYVVQKDSPEGAELIERLAFIMRYFITVAHKHIVPISKEIELIENYIELEKLRLRFTMAVKISYEKKWDDVMVPPLLLMPVIENIFKHGVEKRSNKNFADIEVVIADERIRVTTINLFHESLSAQGNGGTGLINLNKRLQLYYGDNYKLYAERDGKDFFKVNLEFPVNVN